MLSPIGFCIFQSKVVSAHSRSKSGSIGAISRDRRYTWRSIFGQFHRLLTLAFNIFVLRVIRHYSTALQNYSATRRLLYFIAYRQFSKWARRVSGLHFFILFSRLVPCCQVVSMLCLKLQLPET
ncbi:hypothetical protein H5410_061157 [Solanum commersonii]|uniref:Uncharacterized protein n=1 Tax=Solanum commersonii TaxID=4109 RepID=A0A9J5W7T4_SOLCO|nr:hypothetical protein H5410_061157 [Solanum commersonii]